VIGLGCGAKIVHRYIRDHACPKGSCGRQCLAPHAKPEQSLVSARPVTQRHYRKAIQWVGGLPLFDEGAAYQCQPICHFWHAQ